jgi:release factor glutamine methyltransferase
LNYHKQRIKALRKIVKKLHPILLVFYKVYSTLTHSYSFNGIKIKVPSGVFNPKLSFSTKYMFDFLSTVNLKNQMFLEIGAGSGVISLLASKLGANVTATDINPEAIETTKGNAVLNNLQIKVLRSDLFESIDALAYDIIVLNPPYYPKTPKNNLEKAWYCGNNFDFFHRFFKKLNIYIHIETKVFMVLSEDCDLSEISRIAQSYGFYFQLIDQKIIAWEMNYIYSIQIDNAN